MRHATVQALRAVHDWIVGHDRKANPSLAFVRACDWHENTFERHELRFTALDAYHLLDGQTVTLPDCPSCAALLDLALEMRTPPGRSQES